MRFARISAHHIKGFEDFSTECSDVNICAGKNGSNKTSTLTLVTGLFGKGNPRMLKSGADRGEISAVIVADDNTETWEVTRVFRPGKVETPTVKNSESGKIGAPSEFLKRIVDSVSIEPISRAMNADEDEQVRILLDTMPLSLEDGELAREIADVSFVPGLAVVVKNTAKLPSGLDAIGTVREQIYNYRRDVNRDAKTKRTHATELLESIPEGALAEDWDAKLQGLEAELSDVRAAESDAKLAVEQRFGAKNEETAAQYADTERSVTALHVAQVNSINEEIDAKIKALEIERDRRQSEVEAIKRDALKSLAAAAQSLYDEARDIRQRKLDVIANTTRPELERLAGEIIAAKQRVKDSAAYGQTHATATRNNKEAEALEQRSSAMSAALDRLDALKTRLLDRLPIKGLSMEGGVISLGGIPLSEKNTAERAKFWLQIGAMRAGELGVVCADGMECLDQETFDTVVKACLGSGLQWFLCRVDDREFRIERIAA